MIMTLALSEGKLYSRCLILFESLYTFVYLIMYQVYAFHHA
jgi:hypothetical protein